ncbi:MAG: tetratricopeptide repeat protein [Lachnospiraceae bacterium]|jgi:tetratricopeptide (TPR) repeat protein|nr:tetratricopeptide repeat protein [Lachnospiraceae bacterium]
MICYNCGATLTHNDFCTNCGADVARYKKIVSTANLLYNEGLDKARVRDLSGAIESLRQCLKLDKSNVDARNLLGLVYFEIGEYVLALNEWVISKNLRPSKNIADDYISLLQDNPNKLDVYSQAVKKFNQALSYCYQGSLDLAVIQLKKVLSLNPKYVQAHQLLALLYINDEQWEDARRELNRAQKIDVGNTITLRYLAETQNILDMDDDAGYPGGGIELKGKRGASEGGRLKKDAVDSYSSPVLRKETKTATTVLNVAIGIMIGIAVAYLLILPARISAAREGVDENLKAAGEQLDAKTAQITSLEQDLKIANTQADKLKEELEVYIGENGTMTAMDSLLSAVNSYLDNPEDMQTVAEYLDQIDEATLESTSESFTTVYNLLLSKIGTDVSAGYYDSGMKAYQSEMYEDAIKDLTKAYSYDNSNGDALYNLGNAYRKSGDIVNAIDTYNKVIEEFPDTEMATRSQQYVNELNVD